MCMYRCGADTCYWTFRLISTELSEVVTQLLVLFTYNGKDIIFGTVNLANKDTYVIAYAIIISSNCFMVSLSWFLYTFLNKSCHGDLFYLMLWMFDMLFETIYVLFPVLFVLSDISLSNDTVVKASAMLNKQNALLFIQVLLPSIMLMKSMFTEPRKLLQLARNAWLDNPIDEHPNKSKDLFSSSRQYLMYVNSESCASLVCNKHQLLFISPGFAKPNGHDMSFIRYTRQQRKRKCCLLLEILVILGAGVAILATILSHFSRAKEFCDNYVTNHDMLVHREMYTWNDYCDYKVYPFVNRKKGDIPCQCRVLVINENDFRYTLIKNHSNTVIRNIVLDTLENFYMMEAISINLRGNTMKPIDLTANMFESVFMRVFEIKEVGINTIDTHIRNWKSIQYLSLGNTYLLSSTPLDILHNELMQLTQIKYLDIEKFYVGNMDFICSMKELTYIIFPHNSIDSIPECLLVGNLTEIKIINFDYLRTFEFSNINRSLSTNYLDISRILGLPKLEHLSMYASNISIFDFGNQTFTFGEDTEYIFGNTRYLCGYYYWYPHQLYLYSPFLWMFMNRQNVCDNFVLTLNGKSTHYSELRKSNHFSSFLPLSWSIDKDKYYEKYGITYNDDLSPYYKYNETLTLNEFHDLLNTGKFEGPGVYFCSPEKYGNGVCDWECNAPSIGFDGGDCMQLCDFNTCTPYLFSEIDEGCSSECNNTDCNYDNFACRTGVDTELCTIRSGFNDCANRDSYNWIDDGWCHDPCNIPECNYDNNACQDCNSSPHCIDFATQFNLAASLTSTDYLIDRNEFDLAIPLISAITSVHFEGTIFTNDVLWKTFNLDNNTYLNGFETMMLMKSGLFEQGLDEVLLRGEYEYNQRYINCSLCFPNVQIYYAPWDTYTIQYYISNAKSIIKSHSDTYMLTNHTQT